MRALRVNITKVRKIWQNTAEYDALKSKIKAYVESHKLSSRLHDQITVLLSGYSDWADMDYSRPGKQREGWTAIELYCSADGYSLLFGLFNAILRQKEVDDNTLLVTTALVEFVTIELYNFRLANIGDPHYENFEGFTYRGMSVSPQIAAEYRKAATNPDLSKRHFGVPLGFTSSSTSNKKMEEFAQERPGEDQMHWVIHIHGLDQNLVQRYRERYDDSVVTSITAMPVGKISEQREKEILLRGAFFHIVSMESDESDGRMIHTLHLVMMNTNRDHGTELALDDGAKQEQRNFFRDMILASRYRICSEISRSRSLEESEKYAELASTALGRIDATNHFGNLAKMDSAIPTPYQVLTWYGSTEGDLFSTNYSALRTDFHRAARSANWTEVYDIIVGDYEWEAIEWFNLPSLETPWTGRTLVHEMADFGPPSPEDKENLEGWLSLVTVLREISIWKTLVTADTAETAHEIAYRKGFTDLATLLKPTYFHMNEGHKIRLWEKKVHDLITSLLAKCQVKDELFHMPQLSVMAEMKAGTPLWVPIAGAYGGLLIRLEEQSLIVEEIENVKGATMPRRTRHQLDA